MDAVATQLAEVLAAVEEARAAAGRVDPVTLVAVSKTFSAEHILPALEADHRVFGENRVQEGKGKFPALREKFGELQLHLIGPLQTNKAKDAVRFYDVIETVDREKVAEAIAAAADSVGRMPRCLVQVNIGREPQKAGVAPEEAAALVERCRTLGLPVEGLMAIPPQGEAPDPYFAAMAELAAGLGLATSMGMSGDFRAAIAHGARWVRVGSAIFGTRPPLGA